MHWFYDLISNPFLITSISSWLLAQIIKVIVHAVIYKKFDIMRLFGDGGMPSAHSATVSSLATICGLYCGLSSAPFTISAILAIIVCHDAMGVRRETGKQTQIINELIKSFDILSAQIVPEIKLKEFVGHTPIQVISGILVGILNALVMYHFVF